MKNEKLKYESLQPIDKKSFLQKMKDEKPEGYIKLLIQLRDIDDLDFAEEIFRKYMYDDNHFVAETALYSLGYLGVVRKKLINLDIEKELKNIAIKKPLLSDIINETLWEIKKAWGNNQ